MANVPTHRTLVLTSIFILTLILIGSAWNTGSRLFFPGESMEVQLRHVVREYQSGRIDEAYFRLQTLERRAPKNATVQYMLGQCLEAMGREDQAIEHYEKSLRLDDRQAAPHYNLAVIHNRRQETEPAIAQLQEALMLNRNFHGARFMLAGLFLEEEKYKHAADELEDILRNRGLDRPFEIRVRLFLARAYVGTGNKLQAREQYNHVLRLDHTNQEAQDGLADLHQ
jgi:tetratricopeptide (TPR) repeat protein